MEDTRILDKLDIVLDSTSRLDERVKMLTSDVVGLSGRIDKYNDVTGRLKRMEENCARVQKDKASEKARWRLTPGVIVGSVIGGAFLIFLGYMVQLIFG